MLPTEAAIQTAQQVTGWNKVLTSQGRDLLPRVGMSVDLGGIGKNTRWIA